MIMAMITDMVPDMITMDMITMDMIMTDMIIDKIMNMFWIWWSQMW